ncbi:MAG TPA: AlpA family phage regulatory protein [Candidatus Binataceae bacterium]|nr:AlpA family phage regulatory protein [Candidatus Binataceae bacterium]
MQNAAEAESQGFLRLPQVLTLYPVSRSTWWNGVKAGKFPKPFKLGPRTTAWRKSDILALLAKAGEGEQR